MGPAGSRLGWAFSPSKPSLLLSCPVAEGQGGDQALGRSRMRPARVALLRAPLFRRRVSRPSGPALGAGQVTGHSAGTHGERLLRVDAAALPVACRRPVRVAE